MSSSSHYYNRRGEPRYTYGPDKKPTTVTQARKNGWVPSVTTILGLYPKIGLDISISNELMDLAASDPFRDGGKMSRYQWHGKQRAEQREKSMEAARIGTLYHDAIEAIIKDDGLSEEHDELSVKTLYTFREWWNDSKLEALDIEAGFASDLGYGGKIDLVAEDGMNTIYVDWKTQRTTPGKPVNFWPTYALQLEAYARGDMNFHGVDLPSYDTMSVVISSTEPGRIESKVWDKHDEHWDAFLGCLAIWKYDKKYDPSFGGEDDN